MPFHLTGNPLIDIALNNRGITVKDEINFDLNKMLPITSLTGAEDVALKLLEAIKKQSRIVIIGDYDCDGATSTAVMIRMLKSFNANVGWLIPDREKHGYGLSPLIVEDAFNGWVNGDLKHLPEMQKQIKENAFAISRSEMLEMDDLFKDNASYIVDTAIPSFQTDEKPDVILTVDNGIANLEGVALARKLGIDVLITDHHLAGDTLPNATAIVNPNEPNNTFKSKALCGVGVAWYVCVILARLAKLDPAIQLKPTNPLDLLPLVAIGTIADVVALDENNRILVANGLNMLRSRIQYLGLETLIQCLNLSKKHLSSMDIGFYIAPCLNAAGRIKHMGIGVLNLITDDYQIASITANQLYHLNQQRKSITKNVIDESVHQLISEASKHQTEEYILVFAPTKEQSWHEGVIGIAAGKIKEQTNKPTIVFSYNDEKKLYKGSCRSISALHFKDLLDAVNLIDPTLMANYGGHAMAAGLSVHADKLDRFIQIIHQEVAKTLSKQDFIKYKLTDGQVNASLFTVDNVNEMNAFIWGQKFPSPIFHGKFSVINEKRIGKENEHARLTLQCNGKIFNAVRFHCPDWQAGSTINVTFQANINRWQGKETVQLLLLDEFNNETELTSFADFLMGNVGCHENEKTHSHQENLSDIEPAYKHIDNTLPEW